MQKNDGIKKRRVVMRTIIFCYMFVYLFLGIALSHAQTKNIDGYRDIPWGTDFQKVKKLKKFQDNMGDPSNEFINKDKYFINFINKDKYEDVDYVNSFLAFIFDVPTYVDSFGDETIDLKYVPKKFTTVYVASDDVCYIFYAGKFIMTFSKLKGTSNEEYLKSLSEKYEKVTTISKYFPPSNAERHFTGFYSKSNLTADLFSKGETNVYLIRDEIYHSGMNAGGFWIPSSTNTYFSILYISESHFNLIKKEIKAEIEKIRAKEAKDKKEEIRKIKESDLNKFQ
jgi:hypothetical protein